MVQIGTIDIATTFRLMEGKNGSVLRSLSPYAQAPVDIDSERPAAQEAVGTPPRAVASSLRRIGL